MNPSCHGSNEQIFGAKQQVPNTSQPRRQCRHRRQCWQRSSWRAQISAPPRYYDRNYGAAIDLSVLRRRFNAAIRRGTPDTIDLLVVCSEAGMGLESALERVAGEMNRSNPAMARVLYGLLDDLRVLPTCREAFEKLGTTSEGLRRFGTMISQSLQYGTPLSQALRSIATELRRESITKLEERAHKLGAKMTVPMVLFMLPAMFIIMGASPFLHLIAAFQPLSTAACYRYGTRDRSASVEGANVLYYLVAPVEVGS